jgi:ubiquinone/menaquinone biosynthesis C-methylase UbiE
MDLNIATELIKPAITGTNVKSNWADLGCGTGLFTSALAQLLHEGSTIYAVDLNKRSLERLQPFSSVELKKIVADFSTDDLAISKLDGILMANSLHFVKDKISFIQKAQHWLKKDGFFLIVEYDMDKSNTWVPYPLSFDSSKRLFSQLGFAIKKIGEHASVYNRSGMYAAVIKR